MSSDNASSSARNCGSSHLISSPSPPVSSSASQSVELPILDRNNYRAWSKQMITKLASQKELWDIVQHGYERPRDATELTSWGDGEKNQYRELQKTDAKALLYIQQAVNDEIMEDVWKAFEETKLPDSDVRDEVERIMEAATSKDVWEVLKNKYAHSVEEIPEKLMVIEIDMETEMGYYLQKEMDITRSKLFRFAMRGAWNEVIEIYTRKAVAHCLQITNSGDTALHIAVIDGKEEVVKKLVNLMSSTEANEALQVKNERGNTPLHLGALVGNVQLCNCIALKVVQNRGDNILVGLRNNDNQTPLYLAAFHGKKDAFLCLHDLVPGKGNLHYRAKNGETILHAAISGEFFDLAFQIIHLYPEVVNLVNERGNSPLHHLASRPTAFRSGLSLGIYYKIVYHCTPVDKLVMKEREQSGNSFPSSDRPSQDSNNHGYPENYETCINVLSLLKKIFYIALGKQQQDTGSRKKKQEDTDTLPVRKPSQNVNNRSGRLQKLLSWLRNANEAEKGSTNNRAQGSGLVPPNCETTFELMKLAWKAMLVILGLGSMKIRRIREKKENHTWSVQVLDKLLDKASAMYTYGNNGRNPTFRSVSSEVKTIEEELKSADEKKTIEEELKSADEKKGTEQATVNTGKEEAATLMVAENGITEIVERILKRFPGAFQDTNSQQKNVGVLAVENTEPYDHQILTWKEKTTPQMLRRETAILVAAKNGITEIVEKILDKFPVAVHDVDSQNKNVVLLAVENRQPHVYKLLLNLTEKKKTPDRIFRQVDDKGNSAMHLAAATVGEYKPWRIPGAALQMQWEIKWYKFVKYSMPPNFFARHNFHGQTPKDIFTNTHQDLVKSGGEWLTNTSESCSVVAALIATVAFATAATVPGGTNDETGAPVLEKHAAFEVFAVSSLVALCSSVTSVVLFLAILTSRYEAKDFGTDLPRKLLIGLTSLFVSIGAILLCFCAGHFFVLSDELKYAAYPVYGATCLPVTFFAIAQFRLYIDLVRATFKTVPQRRYMVITT